MVIKVIPWFCIAQPFAHNFLRHWHVIGIFIDAKFNPSSNGYFLQNGSDPPPPPFFSHIFAENDVFME